MARKKSKNNNKNNHNSQSKGTASSVAATVSATPVTAANEDHPVDTVSQTLPVLSNTPVDPNPKDNQAEIVTHSSDVESESMAHPYTLERHDSLINSAQDEWSALSQERIDLSRATPTNTISHGAASDDQLSAILSAPRLYENDYDDDNFTSNEHSPLIRSDSHDSVVYSDGEDRRQRTRDQREQPVPTTWLQWVIQNGLDPRTWNKQTYIRFFLLASLITLIILSFTVFRVQDHIKDILRYIDAHKRIGAVLFILSYTVACMLFLPGSLFTVGAGFLFKPFPLALLVVLLGDIVAAITAFIFGRYVFYDWVKALMSKHPKFNALDQVIKDDGWKIVVMLRLTPIPFNLITYFFCITSIQLFTVVWATCIGVLPGSCIGIWIGSLLKGLSGIDNPELERKNLVIIGMNVVLIICCILTLSMFGKRSLRKAMKRLDQHQSLTSLHEVEVVVEGVAVVIRELEDNASIPPSLRSTMIEQLAAEETDPDFYYHEGGMEAAQQRHMRGPSDESRRSDIEAGSVEDEREGTTATSSLLPSNNNQTSQIKGAPGTQSSGFTRGEKIAFVVIAFVAILDISICLPLYYRFANEDGKL
ncbi:hypothetical protein BGZ76_009905 [Entomortierella beljakovae]|nr:hypothetical protein BGZ76_009905 [Entomortierella beljakovae]